MIEIYPWGGDSDNISPSQDSDKDDLRQGQNSDQISYQNTLDLP